MKKILSILTMAGILFMAMSCKTNSDDTTGNSGQDFKFSGNDQINLNGMYQYTETKNNITYTSVITITDLNDCDKIITQDSNQIKGKIKAKETPRSYGASFLTDKEIEDKIKEEYEKGKNDPLHYASSVTFEQYKKTMLERDVKPANNEVYDFTCYHNYSNYYSSEIKEFNLDSKNIIVLEITKSMLGENFYYIDKNDPNKLICLKSYKSNNKMIYTKIK